MEVLDGSIYIPRLEMKAPQVKTTQSSRPPTSSQYAAHGAPQSCVAGAEGDVRPGRFLSYYPSSKYNSDTEPCRYFGAVVSGVGIWKG